MGVVPCLNFRKKIVIVMSEERCATTLKAAAWETSHVLILKNRIKKTYSKEETLHNYLNKPVFHCHPLTRYQRQKLTLRRETKKRMRGGEGKKNISPYPHLSPPHHILASSLLNSAQV